MCARADDGDAFEAGIIDYLGIESYLITRGVPRIHPGELLTEALEDLDLSQPALLG